MAEETQSITTRHDAEIDPAGRKIRWARAGHDPALLFAPDGTATELLGPGVTLGVVQDVAYQEQSLEGAAPGSVLVIGSDGVWETRGPSGEMFGKDRTMEAIRQALSADAGDILTAITDAVDRFRGGAPVEDDVTLVVVKFKDAE